MSDLLTALGIQIPIIQAPMGGGPGTPALAAAVSNAGGLGSLAGAYLTPMQITDEIEKTRALTTRPINVNLFAGGYHSEVDRDPAPILELMAGIHEELAIAPPALPAVPSDPFLAQMEAVFATRPAVFSFTFGIPPAEIMRRLRHEQIFVIGTATSVDEAVQLADAGVDAVVAQGAEAGAHRGTFLEDAMLPTLDLVRAIAARIPLPLIASGGIMNGHDIADALSAGAAAVQMGTAFLLCPEAGTSDAYRRALEKGGRTVITRAYSGRRARGIANRFIDEVGERDALILPFPIQNSLTRPMRAASAKAGKPDYLSLWAGTGVARIRVLPAAALITTLMKELADV